MNIAARIVFLVSVALATSTFLIFNILFSEHDKPTKSTEYIWADSQAVIYIDKDSEGYECGSVEPQGGGWIAKAKDNTPLWFKSRDNAMKSVEFYCHPVEVIKK